MQSIPQESQESKRARQKERVRQCTQRIVERFRLGDLPEKLAPLFIKRDDDRPCGRWSWRNQLLTALEGFDDARTYRDWQAVGRQVRKGEHAFYILEPCRFPAEVKDSETGETTTKLVCRGFKAGARFGYEQTDGDELPYKRTDRTIIDGLPLVDVARSWGLKLGCFNGQSAGEAGWFSHGADGGKAIAVGVHNWSTWTHELCHAADCKTGTLVKKHGQELSNEVVAELGGAVLLTLLGHDTQADLGGCFEYVQHYCTKNDKDVDRTCLQLLDRICNAVALILTTADELASVPADKAVA
jgi:hypothetical protein